MYFSEFVFWARDTEDSIGGWLFIYLVYSVVTYILLSVVTTFRVRSVWAIFLAGALYGWLIEGVIVQTMYDDFPLQVSFTGLAWHALISVLIGWYYITNVLVQNQI